MADVRRYDDLLILLVDSNTVFRTRLEVGWEWRRCQK